MRGTQPSKTRFKIRLQIFRILKTDLNAERWTTRVPFRSGAIGRAIKGYDQAFKATPRISHAEKRETIEHGGNGLL
jgi:hypothetical protein